MTAKRCLNPIDAGADWPLLLHTAKRVIGRQRVNIPWIQRHVRVGFAKAGTLLDLLEGAGVVSPATGDSGGYREVLVPLAERDSAMDQLEAMAGAHTDA